MGRSVSHYREQLSNWWKACPWTITYAICGGETKVGASVVLPLSISAYQAVREGALSDLHIEPDHLEQPSRSLFVNAVTNSYETLPNSRIGWITARQFSSVMYQAAKLAWSPDSNAHAGQPIQVMCVGRHSSLKASPATGYKQVGTLKPFDVPLFEILWPDPDSAPWLPCSAGHAYSSVIAACFAHLGPIQQILNSESATLPWCNLSNGSGPPKNRLRQAAIRHSGLEAMGPEGFEPPPGGLKVHHAAVTPRPRIFSECRAFEPDQQIQHLHDTIS